MDVERQPQQHVGACRSILGRAIRQVFGGLARGVVEDLLLEQRGPTGDRLDAISGAPLAVGLRELELPAFRGGEGARLETAQQPAIAAGADRAAQQSQRRRGERRRRTVAEQGGEQTGGHLGMSEPRLTESQSVAGVGSERRIGRHGARELVRRFLLASLELQQMSPQVVKPGRLFGGGQAERPFRRQQSLAHLVLQQEADDLDALVGTRSDRRRRRGGAGCGARAAAGRRRQRGPRAQCGADRAGDAPPRSGVRHPGGQANGRPPRTCRWR